MNSDEKLIDEIVNKFFDLLAQGKTHEQAYDLLVLQGYSKSLVDSCLIDAVQLSVPICSEIVSGQKRGLSPKEVFQVLQAKGYPEPLIRIAMKQFL